MRFERGEKPLCVILRHGEILLRIIAALLGLRAGDLAVEPENKLAHVRDRTDDRSRIERAEHDEIKPRAAAHRSEIHDLGLSRAVAQERRAEVLDSMYCGRVHDGLAIGRGEPEIERRRRRARETVRPRKIQPRHERQMIDRKTRNLFHNESIHHSSAFRKRSYAKSQRKNRL